MDGARVNGTDAPTANRGCDSAGVKRARRITSSRTERSLFGVARSVKIERRWPESGQGAL
jgi:hypothetical protein